MQFQVPQFIEVEDKIVGPLTIKQFVYLGGGVGISVILYIIFPEGLKFISFILIGPIIGLSVALAFYKINNKSFIQIIEAALKYWFSSKLYIWKKQQVKPEAKTANAEPDVNLDSFFAPKLSDSKLRDLSWSLDVNEALATKTRKEVLDIQKNQK